ncbi:MAG: hypothetical protein ACLPKB_19320 [Xanthobacteraceae bacterium]
MTKETPAKEWSGFFACRGSGPLSPSMPLHPCLPTLALTAPEGEQWTHGIKHDGFRMICRREGKRARVFSRNALDWTDRVPAIVEALRSLPITRQDKSGGANCVRTAGFAPVTAAHAPGGTLGWAAK